MRDVHDLAFVCRLCGHRWMRPVRGVLTSAVECPQCRRWAGWQAAPAARQAGLWEG